MANFCHKVFVSCSCGVLVIRPIQQTLPCRKFDNNLILTISAGWIIDALISSWNRSLFVWKCFDLSFRLSACKIMNRKPRELKQRYWEFILWHSQLRYPHVYRHNANLSPTSQCHINYGSLWCPTIHQKALLNS